MAYYLKVGGPLMWILFGLSILSLTIILERVVYFVLKEKNLKKTFKSEIIYAVSNKNMETAYKICDKEKNTIGSTVKEFLIRFDANGDFHHFDQLVKEIAMERVDGTIRIDGISSSRKGLANDLTTIDLW